MLGMQLVEARLSFREALATVEHSGGIGKGIRARCRIVVGPGFDPQTLRQVVAALES